MVISKELQLHSPPNLCKQKVHLRQTPCLLCRQRPTAGDHILDLTEKLLEATVCKIPCVDCSLSPYPLVWFHKSCYDILQGTYEPGEKPTLEDLRRFAETTKPSYKTTYEDNGETDSAWEGLSSKYTSGIIQDSFRQDLLCQLPLELRIMISELVAPCWYLILLGETRRLIEQLRVSYEIPCARLTITRKLWISRITYRGIPYLSRLGTEPLKKPISISDQSWIELPDKVVKVVLSVDFIGLREIQFVGCDSNPSSDGSPWYEILEVKGSQLNIDVKYNGLFIKGIKLVPDNPSSTYRIWSSPIIPSFRISNCHHARYNARLHYIKLDTHVQGLLACCTNDQMVGLHGFSKDSKALWEFIHIMYKRAPQSHKYWIYYPLNESEYITSAWIRRFTFGNVKASKPVLVIRTSLARTVTFGPRPLGESINQYKFCNLVNDDDGAISGVFHDGLDPDSKYITEFGVTCSGLHLRNALESPPMDMDIQPPTLPPSQEIRPRCWYVTRASLKGLIKVQVCKDRDRPHCPYLGLLLFYSDDHIESLGQIRWDRDLTQEVQRPTLIEHGTFDGKNYIKDVRTETHRPELSTEHDQVQKLPRCGTIVWWFGPLGDQILIH